MPVHITNIEVLGEDGVWVKCSLSDGTTAVLESDHPKVKEFKDANNK